MKILKVLIAILIGFFLGDYITVLGNDTDSNNNDISEIGENVAGDESDDFIETDYRHSPAKVVDLFKSTINDLKERADEYDVCVLTTVGDEIPVFLCTTTGKNFSKNLEIYAIINDSEVIQIANINDFSEIKVAQQQCVFKEEYSKTMVEFTNFFYVDDTKEEQYFKHLINSQEYYLNGDLITKQQYYTSMPDIEKYEYKTITYEDMYDIHSVNFESIADADCWINLSFN